MPTASEIAIARQVPLSMGLLMALLLETPFLSAMDCRTTAGIKFLSLGIVSLPASSFANLGEGFINSEGQLELREFSCSLIGGLIKAELISAALWDKANAAAGESWLDLQTRLKFAADGLNIEKQLFYGTANDPKGFPGFKEMTPHIPGNILAMTDAVDKYSFRASVVDAGGTTANTASSVLSIRFGEMDAQLILGNDSGGELVQIGQPFPQMIAPDSNAPTKLLQHVVQQLQGFIGLSVAGFNPQQQGQTVPAQYSVRRLANCTGDTGDGVTDAKMTKLTLSHGPGKRPSLLVMSARSGEQLAASRAPTAVNFVMGQSGDASKATYTTYPPPPENWQGIPIAYPHPNSLGNSDAIEV